MKIENRMYKLASRPLGEPTASNWDFVTETVRELEEGEVLVKLKYLSIDPAMRGWMNAGKSYIRPVEIGEVMRAGSAGVVVQSKHADFQEGDHVIGVQGVQEYGIAKAKDLNPVDISIAPLARYLGTLGMPGMTAYFGFLETGMPKAGESVVVSGAAGAVGSVVGQIAKIKGCRVVGIAGGAEKCRFIVDELGFDEAIDYKSEKVRSGLKRACPQGVDIYFDNVGGPILDEVLTQIRYKARIVICGAISQYNNTTPVHGPTNYLSLLVNRARMEGIVVFDNAPRYQEAAKEMAQWIAEGKLKSKEHIEIGIENFPQVLLKLFSGQNFGKLILEV